MTVLGEDLLLRTISISGWSIAGAGGEYVRSMIGGEYVISIAVAVDVWSPTILSGWLVGYRTPSKLTSFSLMGDCAGVSAEFVGEPGFGWYLRVGVELLVIEVCGRAVLLMLLPINESVLYDSC